MADGYTHDFEMPAGLTNSSSNSRLNQPLVAAINSLKPKDFSKLHACAVVLFNRIRHLAPDKSPDDLLHEAMMRSLAGVRNWKPDRVSFAPYLISTMESIVDHWRKQHLKLQPLPLDENFNSFDPRYSISEELQAREDEAALRLHFQDDKEAWDVLNLLMECCTPAAIREELNLSPHAYHAGAKRARRKAQAAAFEQLRMARKADKRFASKSQERSNRR